MRARGEGDDSRRAGLESSASGRRLPPPGLRNRSGRPFRVRRDRGAVVAMVSQFAAARFRSAGLRQRRRGGRYGAGPGRPARRHARRRGAARQDEICPQRRSRPGSRPAGVSRNRQNRTRTAPSAPPPARREGLRPVAAPGRCAGVAASRDAAGHCGSDSIPSAGTALRSLAAMNRRLPGVLESPMFRLLHEIGEWKKWRGLRSKIAW